MIDNYALNRWLGNTDREPGFFGQPPEPQISLVSV
jgi:hypothetical protein